jgi:hypothetical protein
MMSFLSLAGFVLRSGRRVLNFLPNSSSARLYAMVLCGVALCCNRYTCSLMYGSSLSTPDVWKIFLRCFMKASTRPVASGSSALHVPQELL